MARLINPDNTPGGELMSNDALNDAEITTITAAKSVLAERRRAAVDKTVAEAVAYVKAHPGMLDDLAGRDLSTAAFLVAESTRTDADLKPPSWVIT